MSSHHRQAQEKARRAYHPPTTLLVKPGLRCPLEQSGELATPCQGRTVSRHTGRGSDVEWQHAGYALKYGLICQADAMVKGDHTVQSSSSPMQGSIDPISYTKTGN